MKSVILEKSLVLRMIHLIFDNHYRALQLQVSAWNRFVICHCSITLLEIRPDVRIKLRYVGCVNHIARDQVSN